MKSWIQVNVIQLDVEWRTEQFPPKWLSYFVVTSAVLCSVPFFVCVFVSLFFWQRCSQRNIAEEIAWQNSLLWHQRNKIGIPYVNMLYINKENMKKNQTKEIEIVWIYGKLFLNFIFIYYLHIGFERACMCVILSRFHHFSFGSFCSRTNAEFR